MQSGRYFPKRVMKRIDVNSKCRCGCSLEILDGRGWSVTVRCRECSRCSLVIASPTVRLIVALSNFHCRCGDGSDEQSLIVRPLATRLLDSLILDQWPSGATTVDWGIDSASHLGALQHAVLCGITAYDLDRVLGDGPAITALTRGVPRQPYREIVFVTAYDGLFRHQEQP